MASSMSSGSNHIRPQHLLPNISTDAIYKRDIFHAILFFLDYRTITNVMRVSRLFYEYAAPFLYRNIIVDPHCSLGFRGPEVFDVDRQTPFSKQQIAISGIQPSEPSETIVHRTSKRELIKKCKVLQIMAHATEAFCNPRTTGCQADPGDFREMLNPDVLVMLSGYDGKRVCVHLDSLCDPKQDDDKDCTLIEHLSPNKLVFVDWDMKILADIKGLPTFKSVKTIVWVLPSTIYRIGYDSKPTKFPDEARDPNLRLSEAAGHSSIEKTVIIFPRFENCIAALPPGEESKMIRSVSMEWLEACLMDLLYREERCPRQTTEFINARQVLIRKSSTAPTEYNEDCAFPLLLKHHLFHHKHTSSLSRSKLEDIWDRIHFVTKEEYLKRGRSDLEGEMPHVEWRFHGKLQWVDEEAEGIEYLGSKFGYW